MSLGESEGTHAIGFHESMGFQWVLSDASV